MDRKYVVFIANELDSWLQTFYDGQDDEDDDSDGEIPKDLDKVVTKLKSNKPLTLNEWNLVLFHLWQLSFGREDWKGKYPDKLKKYEKGKASSIAEVEKAIIQAYNDSNGGELS